MFTPTIKLPRLISKLARTLSVGLGLATALLGALAAHSAGAVPVKIMCLGDSITHGGYGYASYRYQTYFKLTDAGYDVDFVGTISTLKYGVPPTTDPNYPLYTTTFDRNHQGDWGKDSAWVAARIAGYLTTLGTGRPDIALINLGTNDTLNHDAPWTKANLDLIIGHLRSANPNVKIVLSSLLPLSVRAQKVIDTNTAIAALASERNTTASPVIFVDTHTGYNQSAWNYDALHPNVIGEGVLAQHYFNALQTLLSPPSSGGAVIVDNAQTADVSLIGSWNVSTVAPGYYGSNYIHDNNTGKGTKAVMFLPTLAASGQHLVYARWIADPNRATNVPIDVVSTGGLTSTVTVNQQLNGAAWNLLGLYDLATATAEVTVRNAGTNGYVLADAVQFVPLASAGGSLVDNATAASTVVTGSWAVSTGTPGYLSSNYAHDGNAGKGTKVFGFKPAVAATGLHRVYARWPAEVNRATNVPVDIVTSGGGVTTVTVNQQTNGNTWNLLGTFTLAPANAEVRIRTTGTNGFVVADGVAVVPAP